jgi:hypothetical protein
MSKVVVVLIMMHGIMGWGEKPTDKRDDQMKVYYNGVKPFLKAYVGEKRPDVDLVMIAPQVPRADKIENRGRVLRQTIEDELKKWPTGTRVHILAHSMGGLDSRWALAQDGMADKIASLTTIATPHRGTSLGDLAYDELPIILPAGKVLEKLYVIRRSIWRHLPFTRMADPDLLGFFNNMLFGFDSTPEQLYDGMHALTLEGAETFNRELAEKERAIRERKDKPVKYFAYGGRTVGQQVLLLKPAHAYIEKLGTDQEKHWGDPKENQPGNDGAVSVWSAHYPWDDEGRNYVRTIPFDHFWQVNWRIPDEIPSRKEMSDDLKTVYREIMDNILQVQRMQ